MDSGSFDRETGEIGSKVRYEQTLEKEFWDPIFNDTDFKEFIKKHYTIGYRSMINADEFNPLQEGESNV